MKKDLPVISLLILSIIGQLTPTSASQPQGHPTPATSKPNCRLEVGDAHISTTILKHRNINVVKVNVHSICNIPQEKVQITLVISKSQLPTDHNYGPFSNSLAPSTSSGLDVSLLDKYVVCSNRKPTEWYGTASAKAFIGGRWLYAGKTRSKNIRLINCGT